MSITSKALTITQCTVAKITALDPTQPAVDISSPDTIIVIGLDTVGGTTGWLLQTDAHELRGVRAKGATGAGIEIAGSFKVTGPGNTLDSNKATANLLDGFTVSGGTAAVPTC